jgi:hypothetical protein
MLSEHLHWQIINGVRHSVAPLNNWYLGMIRECHFRVAGLLVKS